MKLYELQRGDFFQLEDPETNSLTYKFHNLDGAYSYCTDESGTVAHFSTWADVRVVSGFGE